MATYRILLFLLSFIGGQFHDASSHVLLQLSVPPRLLSSEADLLWKGMHTKQAVISVWARGF